VGLFSFLRGKGDGGASPPEIGRAIREVIFPNGESDMRDGAMAINTISKGKLTLRESTDLLGQVKTLFYIASDKGAERMVPSIVTRANGKLTKEQAHQVWEWLVADFESVDNTEKLLRLREVLSRFSGK